MDHKKVGKGKGRNNLRRMNAKISLDSSKVEIIFVIVFERKWKQQSRQETHSALWTDWAFSAVARGGAGGARAPPVFFLKGKNWPV